MARLSAPLVLASGSPRRRELLASLGLAFTVDPVPTDESVAPGESPEAYVERVAHAKLVAALAHLDALHPESFVLTGDTTVVLGDRILGKPEDDADARSMLAGLMGRSHRVLTGIGVGTRARGPIEVELVSTEVRFRAATPDEIVRYVATGEGRDKAGSYAIQGIGGGFVEGIVGSYSNVVGLPVAETLGLLRRAGALVEWP